MFGPDHRSETGFAKIPKRTSKMQAVLTVLKKWIVSLSGGVLDREAQYSRSGMISANKPVAPRTARSIEIRERVRGLLAR
jgi:hypothetical protein